MISASYLLPMRRMRCHIRVTRYTKVAGRWRRCSKDVFVEKMDAEA